MRYWLFALGFSMCVARLYSQNNQEKCYYSQKGVILLVTKTINQGSVAQMEMSDLIFMPPSARYDKSTTFANLISAPNAHLITIDAGERTLEDIVVKGNSNMYVAYIDTLVKQPSIYIADSVKVHALNVDVFYTKTKMTKQEYEAAKRTSVSNSNISAMSKNKHDILEVMRVYYAIPLK